MVGAPPLKGIKVLEFAGLAPGPFAGMLLSDAGASVLRVDRSANDGSQDMLARRKASIAVDLKNPQGLSLIKDLIASAKIDVLIDPFRPGVLEKLGLGPDTLLAVHPGLVYARMTGFRRDGKYADMAGHDINYLAVSGTLGMLGRAGEKPHPPWNILADFAGGGATLFQGILLALLARQTTGKGQVVEANMVDGASYLATFPRMARKTPMGHKPRGENILDGGCPWYDTYETSDRKYMSVGALEPQFFAELMRLLGLGDENWQEERFNESRWPELRGKMERIFKSQTRSHWERTFDGTDACCAPVLDYAELETDAAREGDQRPAVTLRDTPCLAVDTEGTRNTASASSTDKSNNQDQQSIKGQGRGVEGGGYEPNFVSAGHGGEEALATWAGWTKGKEYSVTESGSIVLSKSNRSKL